jgi:hypothetical protein
MNVNSTSPKPCSKYYHSCWKWILIKKLIVFSESVWALQLFCPKWTAKCKAKKNVSKFPVLRRRQRQSKNVIPWSEFPSVNASNSSYRNKFAKTSSTGSRTGRSTFQIKIKPKMAFVHSVLFMLWYYSCYLKMICVKV